MLNSVLLSSAQKIMNYTSPAQFMISARFFNSDISGKFNFYPLVIEEVLINRDYIQNYGDEIDLTMAISPKDYALMQDQGQDLLCILTFTYVNKGGTIVYNPPPVQKKYHVSINDPRDIRKHMPDAQAYTEPSLKITVRLVEEAFYKIRHVKINTVFQNATLTKAIHGVTSKLGITSLEMVSLDNVHQYDQVDISSYQGIGSVYQYLQSKFGLYEKGANSYLTDGVLYIYPPFETNPKYDRKIILYQVDNGRYSGASVFHRVENDTVSLVVNTNPEVMDLSIIGAENIGTGIIFNRASRTTDGISSIDGGQTVEFTESPGLSISLNTSRTVTKGFNNLKHVRTTDNPYPDMSEIISHQASMMNVQWMHADPFQLDPGHSVSYYFDRNETMLLKTGILEQAVYSITPMSRMNTMVMFGCVGSLTLRLAPNESIVL